MRGTLEQQMAAVAEMPPSSLPAAWRKAYGAEPPRLAPELLRMGLGYKVQEKALGKLPARVARSIDVTAAGGTDLPIGAELVRSWNGQTIRVEVRDNGYWWNERKYRSLTAIAKEVTGVVWSGPRFFGIKQGG